MTAPVDLPTDRSAPCPRCGYDLRALCAQWTTECPLSSPCTECGYVLEWRDILGPARVLPAWHAERRHAWRRFPYQTLITTIRALTVVGFWFPLRLSMTHRWRRLVAYLIIVAALSYAAVGLTAVAAIYPEAANARTALATLPAPLRQSPEAITLRAFLLPLNDLNPGDAFVYTPFGQPIPPPMRFSALEVFAVDDASEVLVPAIVLFWLPLVTCATFICMPFTRRRCRTRAVHFVRVTAYQYAPSMIILAQWLIVPAVVSRASSHVLYGLTGPMVIAGVFNLIWWMVALKWYLRFPRAIFVAILQVILGTLLTSFAVAGTFAAIEALFF